MSRLLVPLVTTLLWAAGCGSHAAREAAEKGAVRPAHRRGIENLRRVSDTVYSGGEPEGPAAFRALARFGIRTLVSVDGTRPDLEAAREAGLRYVHVPIGYDGISREASAALTRIARDLTPQNAGRRGSSSGRTVAGPVYVHCHHGRHRGPAAAAMLCMAAGELDAAGATRVLEEAGTSRDYAGLWRDVAAFQPPPAGTVLPELVEVAQVDSLVAAMAAVDRAFDNLRLCREAGWNTPRMHPDLVPAREAVLLREGFREARRHESDERDERLIDWLRSAESDARALAAALEPNASGEASAAFQRIGESCDRCHERYRDGSMPQNP